MNYQETSKFIGFPRLDGHCKEYYIKDYDINGLREIINSGDFEDLFDIQDQDDKENIKILRDPPKMLEILDYLKDDLVYGDLVRYSNSVTKSGIGLCIFDGLKLKFLDFDAMDGYGLLPQQFSVLTNNVPMNYWDLQCDNSKFITNVLRKGINNNSCIWLNISENRNELINNIIKCDKENIYITSFKHNNKIYKLNCYSLEYDVDLLDIKNVFTLRNTILLSRNDFGEILKRNPLSNELFFDVDYCSILLNY